MAEPTSASSAAAVAIASGTTGAILVALGITWPLLLWGCVGCIVGLSYAPTTGRVRAFALFGAASLLSAKGGAVGAIWAQYGQEAAQGIAAALGIVFHPLLAAIVAKLPEAVSRRLAP